jgi:hypothetical protein
VAGTGEQIAQVVNEIIGRSLPKPKPIKEPKKVTSPTLSPNQKRIYKDLEEPNIKERETSLEILEDNVRGKFEKLIQRIEDSGLPFKIYETMRTPERQEYLFRAGRTPEELEEYGLKPGPAPKSKKKVTWTLDSRHLTGRAVDFVFDTSHKFWDRYGKKPSNPWDTSDPFFIRVWQALGHLAKKEGFKWGGDWKARDYPHVELPVNSSSNRVAQLSKSALAVTVEPYQSLVNEVMMAIESKRPGYFGPVKRVVLEQGSPDHFGMVRTDKPDTIFISFQKIQNAVAGVNNVQAMKAALCEVLTHEMGHLKSNFQGGESPAEAEESAMKSVCEETATTASLFLQTAQELGGTEEKLLMKGLGIKTAMINTEVSPHELSQSILRILYHFGQKVNPENQARYIDNLKGKLYSQLNPMEISGKKKNPGAGVGASISIIKNMLSGEDLETVNSTLQLVLEGLLHL